MPRCKKCGKETIELISRLKARWMSPEGEAAKVDIAKIYKRLWDSKEGLLASKQLSKRYKRFYRETSYI